MSCLFPICQRKQKKKSKVETIENGSKKIKSVPKTVRATVVLAKPGIVDTGGVHVDALDWVRELLGRKVSLQLISAVKGDVDNRLRGKLGKPAYLENWRGTSTSTLKGTEAAPLNVTFEWDEEMGVPGAFVIRNEHENAFLLKTVTIEDVPGHGRVHFVCNSWVYPTKLYKRDRVFFSNKTYLPHETPEPLREYREEELENLRGDGTGERKEWERIYDYDVYNDLSEPSKGPKHMRPILGGSAEHPYPRRGRTGRPHTKEDPSIESRPMLLKSIGIYIPRDERFGPVKMADVVEFGIKALLHFVKPGIEALIERDFDNLEEIMEMYESGAESFLDKIVPSGMFKDLLRPNGEALFKFPKPQVIEKSVSACMTDEEFARQMLAGINPVVICRLKVFPAHSKLDPKNNLEMEKYLKNNMEGLTPKEAIERSKLFILDHHDTLMPFLQRINDETSTKTYATRTLLFLKADGVLKPLAIELSLPDGDGVASDVYTPAEHGTTEGTLWELAKAYVNVNDSGCHQLISHWLKTHAAIEPFIIATNRQLSALHPINKILHPHFRDTMNINAFGRQILISAGGALEMTVCPAKYSLEITSMVYKDWVFPEQALPADLIKRGMATKDDSAPHGVRLTIEDYPFAVDGLEVWSAIESWVQEYCYFYYKEDEAVQKDTELQSWWTELREKGHGDHRDKSWWPRLDSREELVHTCTIIIWVASALHAAINFGQYPYGGYMPSRPAMSRRLLPKKDTEEYKELAENPDRAFLKTVTSRPLTVLGNSLVEILSRHSEDEVYLGKRDTPNWTSDAVPLEAFGRFGERLRKIEANISERNNDRKWKNRAGAIDVPYTLLYPSSEPGLTGKGIPNSISM